MTKKHIQTDVLIIGGGLAGMTLVGVLGRAGVRVVCVDGMPPVTQMNDNYDARATALSWTAHQVLRAAGVWDDVAKHAEPAWDIRVVDGDAPVFVHFDTNEHGNGQPFGWNIENTMLRKVLYKNLQDLKGVVTHLAPAKAVSFFHDDVKAGAILEDGTKISAPLMIGADGRHSSVRKFLNIDAPIQKYTQTAIVCTITHEKDHENVALEHFFPPGPFALIPLTKDKKGKFRNSVIWSMPHADAETLIALPEKDFNNALQEKCGDYLGKVKLVAPPRGYPLSLMHAERYTDQRIALMAEAAHVMHPIAGQGLNVSMRDIAFLAEMIVDQLSLGLDIGSTAALDEYEKIRQQDVRLMILFTDVLNKLFSNDFKSLDLLRNTGLGVVEKTPVLKGFFARQAIGLGGKPGRIIRTGQALED